MLRDQRELLEAFNALDIFIRSDETNSKAVYAALASFGAPMEGLSAEDFHDKVDAVMQLGVAPNRIDILQSIEGVSFAEAWRDHVDLDIEGGTLAHYLSLDALIPNKELVNRPGDLADVHELRKMRDLKYGDFSAGNG